LFFNFIVLCFAPLYWNAMFLFTLHLIHTKLFSKSDGLTCSN
jgi:hypothetical protein